MEAVNHLRVDVDGVEVFYRESGPKDAPVVLSKQTHRTPRSSSAEYAVAWTAGGSRKRPVVEGWNRTTGQ
jgi:hypothetical protein